MFMTLYLVVNPYPKYGISRSLMRGNSASWTFAVPRSPAPYWGRPEESCRLLRRSLRFETLAVVPAPVPQQRRDSLWNITIFEKFGATVIFEAVGKTRSE